jgi:hypothetical protein
VIRLGGNYFTISRRFSKVGIGNNLSINFPTQIDLKQEAALLRPPSHFAIEYAISKVQENQVGLKLHGTYRFCLTVMM